MALWDGMGSAYERLREQHAVMAARAEQTVEAVLSSSAESEVFGFQVPQPCLLFKRLTYTDTDGLIEYIEGTFRGDAYAYRMALKA